MNWTWELRSRDGGMNGLEFARCTTAGNFSRVLVHAAPAHLQLEVRADAGTLVLREDADRDGDYSPVTLLELDGGQVRRREVWPGPELYGLPVLLPGGEVGILTSWEHAGTAAGGAGRSSSPTGPAGRPTGARRVSTCSTDPGPDTPVARHPRGVPGHRAGRSGAVVDACGDQRCGPMPCELRPSMMRADSSKPITTTASGAKSTICWISAS